MGPRFVFSHNVHLAHPLRLGNQPLGPGSTAEASTGPPAHPLRLDGSCGWSQLPKVCGRLAWKSRTNGDAALPPDTFSNPCNIARREIVSYALIPSMDVMMVASSSMSQMGQWQLPQQVPIVGLFIVRSVNLRITSPATIPVQQWAKMVACLP